MVTPYSATDKAGLERSAWIQKEGNGYFQEQATQPQTLGYSLTDSPVGLLAWIYEKLVNWTDSYPWTDDEGKYLFLDLNTGRNLVLIPDLSPTRYLVLTWISIYYFSRAGPAASVRIYYEVMHSKNFQAMTEKPKIPWGLSHFLKELRFVPRK